MATITTTKHHQCPHRIIRRHNVRFGNPTLGTYGGSVYTVEEDTSISSSNDDDDEHVDHDAEMQDNNNNTNSNDEHDASLSSCISSTSSSKDFENKCLAAMLHVPPEQVPEGILTFARAHRRHIRHVRVLTSSPTSVTDDESYPPFPPPSLPPPPPASLSPPPPPPSALSPSTSAIENAAEIIALEDESPTILLQNEQKIIQTQILAERLQKQQDDMLRKRDQQQPKTFLILFELSTHAAAGAFVDDLHDKPYTTLEDDVRCTAKLVSKVECGSDDVVMSSPNAVPSDRAPPPPPSLLLLPPKSSTDVVNCAVCLDTLDVDTPSTTPPSSPSSPSLSHPSQPSLFTTVCNHTFHVDCLLRCQDSPCPVCRYDHAGWGDATLSECHVCGKTSRTYVCLICGVVSCSGNDEGDEDGRQEHPAGGHARQHYDETLHAYALEIESQHVWDFAGDGFVHRLIRNDGDGKLVEIADPSYGDGGGRGERRMERPGLSSRMEGEVVHRKLERFASRYYTLLKSQLEQQRIYYEGRLEEIIRDNMNNTTGNDDNKNANDLIAALKQDRHQKEQRLVTLRKKYAKITKDVEFLRHMNESLEANKAPLQRKIAEAKARREEVRRITTETLPPLQEKVNSLMRQLEFGVGGGGDDRKPAARKKK